MKLPVTQCYLYLKAHPQGIVEIQSFVTGHNFFFAVQRNWWDKVWNVSMAIFPFVGSRSWISLVGTAYLSVCMFVCLVCLLLSVYSNGWACHMSTHILFCCVQTGHWVPGLVISSAILCVCLSIYVSTKLQEAKLLHFWFQVCKLSEILQLSSYIFDMNMFAWMVSHEEIQGALWFWDLTLSKF
jgi:hypothetical protein